MTKIANREASSIYFDRAAPLGSTLFAQVIYKPAHDKTYNKTCATSEDSDQPAHPYSLIRIYADSTYLL